MDARLKVGIWRKDNADAEQFVTCKDLGEFVNVLLSLRTGDFLVMYYNDDPAKVDYRPAGEMTVGDYTLACLHESLYNTVTRAAAKYLTQEQKNEVDAEIIKLVDEHNARMESSEFELSIDTPPFTVPMLQAPSTEQALHIVAPDVFPDISKTGGSEALTERALGK